jgi:hypothetical protein
MLDIPRRYLICAVVAPVLFASCASGPPPDEDQFRELVAAQLVEGAKRSGPRIDGTDPVKTVVFDPALLPEDDDKIVELTKRRLTEAGLAWLDADLGGNATALPGEWTTFDSSGLRFNRTHALLSLTIDGRGRERNVRWSYICGLVCGFGRETRFRWRSDGWETKLLSEILH